MCNLFSNTLPPEAMRRLFDVPPERDRLGNQPPLPAIFPRHDAAVVRLGETGGRELVAMHWGFLIPQLSKKTGRPIQPKAVTNARDDRIATASFWRGTLESRRCLIPGTSFCEAEGMKPATYWWFALAGEEARPPFAFAGLWRRWSGRYRGEAVAIDCVSMVTVRANALVAPVHPDRMPAILDDGLHDLWLRGSASEAVHALRPYPAERMRVVRKGLAEKSDPDEAAGPWVGSVAQEARV